MGLPAIWPPNTCHLVAGYEDTLEGLNDLAASLPAFAPSASGYRLDTGRYALVLGLLSTGASDRIIRLSDQLPQDSFCASGADFRAALVHEATGFTEVERGRSQDTATLLAEARQVGDPAGVKHACDLGLGPACTAFASHIYDTIEGPDGGPAVVTRYGLLGCMAGDLEGAGWRSTGRTILWNLHGLRPLPAVRRLATASRRNWQSCFAMHRTALAVSCRRAGRLRAERLRWSRRHRILPPI
ncbi:hypothetical protein QWZ10_00120 [Paracoccus cavernae]|nr:hypothetical protein [Paracoccus cavernae]